MEAVVLVCLAEVSCCSLARVSAIRRGHEGLLVLDLLEAEVGCAAGGYLGLEIGAAIVNEQRYTRTGRFAVCMRYSLDALQYIFFAAGDSSYSRFVISCRASRLTSVSIVFHYAGYPNDTRAGR